MDSNGFQLLDNELKEHRKVSAHYVETAASTVGEEDDDQPQSAYRPSLPQEEQQSYEVDPEIISNIADNIGAPRTFVKQKPKRQLLKNLEVPRPLLFAVCSMFVADTGLRVLQAMGFQYLSWTPAIALLILAYFCDQVRLVKRDSTMKPGWQYTAFTYCCVLMLLPAYLSPVVGSVSGVLIQVLVYAAIFKESLYSKDLEEVFEPASWLLGAFVAWPFIQ